METRRTEHWRATLAVALLASLIPLQTARAEGAVDFGPIADQAIIDLQTYIGIDTVNPPGHTAKAAKWLAERFAAYGIRSTTVGDDPDKPTFLATIPGTESGPSLVLLHHMDVVPVEGQTWRYPPFEGRVADGAIWGRGAVDTKGSAIVMMAAMRALAASGIKPKYPIHYLAVPDEETQGPAGAGWFVDNALERVAPVAYVINEGAVGSIGILHPSRPSMMVQVAEKQPLWLRVISRGDSGHGSTPHDNNAVDHLVRALDRLLDSEPRAEMSPPVAEMMRRNSRLQEFPNSFFSARADQWPFEAIVLRSMKDLSPRTRSMTRNSCSLTGLSAGIKTNVIPSEASAVLDCRLLPTEDPEAFKAKLLETLGEGDLELEVIMQSQSGPVTDWNTPLFAAIEEAVLKHYPEAVVAPYMSSGFTDSAFFRRKGIKAYGFIPFVLNRDEIKGFHNVDERVPVDSFRNAIPIFYDILERFAQTP